MPRLGLPTVSVRASFLQGMSELCAEDGTSTAWLENATTDFESFVADRRAVRELWEVPTTELWFVDETHYFGTVMIRHRLTPALTEVGGHLGYHVVPSERRRGHATAMVSQALGFCCELGIEEILVTCAPENVGSRRAIEANGGTFEGISGGEYRYSLSSDSRFDP